MSDSPSAHPNDNGDDGAASDDVPPSSPLRAALYALNCVGTVVILGLMLLINLDVWLREFFNFPIDGVPEMIELLIVAIVFLQLGDATRAGRLTRSDGLLQFVRRRRPRIGRAMSAVFDLLGALFMLLILIGTWPIFIEAYEKSLYVGDIGRFNAPTWPVKLIIVIGCVMVMAQFIAFASRLVVRPGQSRPDLETRS